MGNMLRVCGQCAQGICAPVATQPMLHDAEEFFTPLCESSSTSSFYSATSHPTMSPCTGTSRVPTPWHGANSDSTVESEYQTID